MESEPDRTEICTFVVRIWLESDDQPEAWRGHVTHALSGERRYFEKFDTLAEFVTHYIRTMSEQGSE